MRFNKHSELYGKHALFSPSKYQWLNDTDENIVGRWCRSYATEIGTILHDYACRRIKYRLKLSKNERKSVRLELLQRGIPCAVVDRLDIEDMLETLMLYVNDGIGYHMTPEVLLYYSNTCFGTTDAIRYSEKDRFLRIHDLKTGVTPAHMEQLMVYAALFCLEYDVKPNEIECELRIYQSGEVSCFTPPAEELMMMEDKIINADRIIFEHLNVEV